MRGSCVRRRTGGDADEVLFRDVTDVWASFDRIERLASSAKTLLAARVDEAGRWQSAGARSAAEYLAKLSGTSTSRARRSLETSKQVAELPAVADAMRAGVLSDVQADAIADAAAADVTKHTVLDETDPLCKPDHDLKTYEGWSLVEGTGRRAFVPPDDPRHPRNKPPP